MFAASAFKHARAISFLFLASSSLLACRTSDGSENLPESEAGGLNAATSNLVSRVSDTVGDSSSRLLVLAMGARECSSCRGVGLAIRTLSSRTETPVVLAYDSTTTQEIQELVKIEKLHVRLFPISSDEARRVVGGDLGGVLVLRSADTTHSIRISPTGDWPTSVEKFISQAEANFTGSPENGERHPRH